MIFISFVNKYTKIDRRKIFLAKIVHLLPFVHLKFCVNPVISVGATFKKLQKSPKNRFSTAFCSILTNVQMT